MEPETPPDSGRWRSRNVTEGVETPQLGCTGHISVLVDRMMVVWGGYGFADDDSWDSNLYGFDLDHETWSSIPHVGHVPECRSGSVGLMHGDHLFVFGGFSRVDEHVNSMWCFDFVSKKWQEISTTYVNQPGTPPDRILPPATQPSKRDKMAAVVYKGKFFYFGGWGPPQGVDPKNFTVPGGDSDLGWNNELWCFDPLDYTWRKLETFGDPPSPRAAHTMTLVGRKAYVFGGRDISGRRADLYSLDMDTLEWAGPLPIVPVDGNMPCGRSWHICVGLENGHLLLQGGLSSNGPGGPTVLGDTFLLDPHSGKLTNLPPCPTPTHWHSAVYDSYTGQLLMFGGSTVSGGMDGNGCPGLQIFTVGVRRLRDFCLRRLADILAPFPDESWQGHLGQCGLPEEIWTELKSRQLQAAREHRKNRDSEAAAQGGSDGLNEYYPPPHMPQCRIS